MEIINPAIGNVLQTVAEHTPQQIEQALSKAQAAQRAWAQRSVADRVAVLAAWQGLLKDQIGSLSETLTSEVGKPLWQSRNEINGAISRVDFFLAESEKWLAPETRLSQPGLEERISFEPLGVVANISAWNYPYLVGVNVFVPALIAGNAVLYKPSEYSTLTGLAIGRLMQEAGVPEEVFQVIVGGAVAGKTLTNLRLDGYFFTGSHRTGQAIYEAVAPKMVPCQLELGGKDPLYIAGDNTDVEAMAEAAMEGAFYNNGQSCCAVERVYVHEAVYEPVLKALHQKVADLKSGPLEDKSTWIGPLARQPQLKVVEDQVKDAVAKGAKVLAGGQPMKREGYYFEPTLLVEVDHTMEVMKAESFGPVIGVQKVASDEEAVQLMLDTDYGLTASVYTPSKARAESILSQMNTGTVYWNCCDRVSPYVPWTGRGHSGFGSTLSYQGIRAFTQPKAWQLRG